MRLLLLALLAAAGTAAAQNTNDPHRPTGPQIPYSGSEFEQERRNLREGATVFPAWPKDENLIEFYVNNTVTFRFYVDAASLSLGKDNVVRYTLLARSPSGVVNVSYEGLRCPEASYRVYGYGQDGRWVQRDSEWRPIELKGAQGWHHELRVRYFCPSRNGTILSAAEGLDALRRGGHPGATGRSGF